LWLFAECCPVFSRHTSLWIAQPLQLAQLFVLLAAFARHPNSCCHGEILPGTGIPRLMLSLEHRFSGMLWRKLEAGRDSKLQSLVTYISIKGLSVYNVFNVCSLHHRASFGICLALPCFASCMLLRRYTGLFCHLSFPPCAATILYHPRSMVDHLPPTTRERQPT